MDELNFTFKMPDDETLAKYIPIKGEKGERGDPTKLSQLDNDTGFVTADTSALANYYTKTATDNNIDAAVTALDDELGVPAGFFTDTSETVTGEGLLITLNGTANAVFKDIKLYGDTSQEGTPAPESPVDVEVVAGDQTIIISDNYQQSQSYTLSLGDMKLCAIGNAKDYIHKANGKWYKHNAIASVTIAEPVWKALNGTSALIENTSSNGAFALIYSENNVSPMSGEILSNYMVWQYQTVTGNAGANTMVDKTFVQRSTNDRIYYRNTDLIGRTGYELTEMTSDLIFYYALSAPVEEEITDAILIEQLDALWRAKSYEENTVISTSGSLAALASVEAFRNNWSGTVSGLNNELDNIYTKSEIDNLFDDKVRLIFPKFWTNADCGDCNLIKYAGKNILIDCYNPIRNDQYTHVKAMMDDNDVKHIDVFICSHYHYDHIGSFERLINDGYIDPSTKLFMPAETTQFGWETDIATYKQMCQTYGLTYNVPDEGEVYTIKNLKLTFTNCDATAMDNYYEAGPGSQNSTSTIVLLEHGSVKALYTGDADRFTYKRLREIDFLKSKDVDLHKIGHHGFEHETDMPFFEQYRAKYAVVPVNIYSFASAFVSLSSEATVLQSNGTTVFPCYMQEDYLEFTSDGSSLSCTSGKPYISSRGIMSTYNVYVDSSAPLTAIQDGTQEHPFKDIMQAVGSAPKELNQRYRIICAPGTYGGQSEVAGSENNGLQLRGVSVWIMCSANDPSQFIIEDGGAIIRNSEAIIEGATIYMDNKNVQAYHSDVQLINCVLTTESGTATEQAAITASQSNLFVKNTTIEHSRSGINAYEGSTLVATGITFGEITTNSYIRSDTNEQIQCVTNTSFKTPNDKYRNLERFTNHYTPFLLYLDNVHNFTVSQIPVNVDLTSFDRIDIEYVNSYTNHGIVSIAPVTNKKMTIVDAMMNSNASMLIENFTNLKIATTKRIDLTAFASRTTTIPDGAMTYNNTTQNIAITRIWGIKEQEIADLT